MKKSNLMLSAVVVGTMLLSAMVLAAPPLSLSGIRLPQIFNSAYAATVTYNFVTETLPNGQPAYRLDDSSVATIPGPTLIVEEGDVVTINGVDDDFSVMGQTDTNGSPSIYTFTASTPGTYVYKDKSSALIGLFGAVVVNAASGDAGSYVDGKSGSVTAVDLNELDKEFVMFMVGSTFWVSEISGGSESPLWTNPTISAVQGDLVRFHILSVGPGHTFHLHAHRWVDPGTTNIIDTKLMDEEQVGEDSHVFIVAAGDQVGPGHWQYHCHVFAHMEAGMHGIFNVVETGPAISEAGASPYAAAVTGTGSGPGLVTFEITDEPGRWFRSPRGSVLEGITATQSLELAKPGDSVNFIMSETNTVHTITSLVWPTGAEHMPMDEVQSYKGGGIVQLNDPGLYVFTCKIHPYMFGAVVVDDASTDGLDLGETVDVAIPGNTIPTYSDLAARLLRTFWIATNPASWQDYDTATNPTLTWHINYPIDAVEVRLTGGIVAPLGPTLSAVYGNDITLETPYSPITDGVGEVWVDTQFEEVDGKTKPGTATAVNVADWTVSKKVALPSSNMNNPHNMWTDDTQSVIYQTEWFDNKLSTFDRSTLGEISRIVVGEAPSHVMTRTDTGDIHVALNGEEGVVEIDATQSPSQSDINRIIAMQGYGQNPTHPHAHWMGFDGKTMVTPNSFTHDSTLYGFTADAIINKQATGGLLPIATGAMPDSSKYYVANLLTSNISVMDMTTGALIKTINLLEDYNPVAAPGSGISPDSNGHLVVGALPIQTPVSPNGIYMVTANTLSGTVTLVDVRNDTAVTTLFSSGGVSCDPGCHGVQFGAKQGGGYYAYVSSKFSNAMLVVDADPNNDGDLSDAAIVGRIVLTEGISTAKDYSSVTANAGTGGQGVLAIPVVYNGWIQNTVNSYGALSSEVQEWVCDLQPAQRDPNDTAAPNVTDPTCT